MPLGLQGVEKLPRRRLCVRRSRLVARLHFRLQQQPRVGHKVGVVDVRGTTRLGRVISALARTESRLNPKFAVEAAKVAYAARLSIDEDRIVTEKDFA